MPTAIGEIKSQSSAPAQQAAGKPQRGGKSAPSGDGGKKKGGLNTNINIKLPSWMRGKVSTKVLTQFTRQLATLVNAGLPLMRGIEVLKRQMRDPQMKEAPEGISDGIASSRASSW